MDYPKTESIRTFLSYSFLASVYLTGQFIETGLGFTIYWYHFLYLLIILYGLRGGKFDSRVLLFLIILTLYSICTYNYGFELVIKQLLNIIFSIVASYYLIRIEHFDFESILKKYILVSKVVLIIGFIQVFFFSVGWSHVIFFVFPFLESTNITTRFQSITSEPSFISLGLVPAVFISLYNFFNRRNLFFNKIWAILFIVGYLLTLASTAYAGLLVMLAILYFKNFNVRKLLVASVGLTLIISAAWVSYFYIKEIRVRIDDTIRGMTTDFTANRNFETLHLSSYILLSNLYVTEQSLKYRPLTGYGLGTHEVTYDTFLPQSLKEYSTLNRQDAGSMLLRLLTETGIIGFVLFFLFTLKNRIISQPIFNSSEEILWLLNASILVLIALYLLRNGNYTINGKMFFFLLYYYTFRTFSVENKGPRQPPSDLVTEMK